MTDLREVKIDFDVHKLIELERRSFAEPDFAVIRRLLKDQLSSRLKVDGEAPAPVSTSGSGRPWAGRGGVTLPHGTELRMEYNGRVHTGVVQNGVWLVEGGQYRSPSAAAGGVARTKDGKRTSLDGWVYWQVKRPGDPEWIIISSLRH